MFFKNSYVVVVNGRVFNYYSCLSEALMVAARVAKPSAVVTVEDMLGNVVKVLTNNGKDR